MGTRGGGVTCDGDRLVGSVYANEERVRDMVGRMSASREESLGAVAQRGTQSLLGIVREMMRTLEEVNALSGDSVRRVVDIGKWRKVMDVLERPGAEAPPAPKVESGSGEVSRRAPVLSEEGRANGWTEEDLVFDS